MFAHDELTERIIGCGIAVHRALGPGLLEATYEAALCMELAEGGLSFERQLIVPVVYKGRKIGEYRPDLVVENRVIVEIKAVDRIIGLHRAQVLAYLRVLNLATGLLMNFNSEVLRSGIQRVSLTTSPPHRLHAPYVESDDSRTTAQTGESPPRGRPRSDVR